MSEDIKVTVNSYGTHRPLALTATWRFRTMFECSRAP
jgi:hypothetical protein